MIYVTPPSVIAQPTAGKTRQAAHRGILAAAHHPRTQQAMTGLRGPRESPGRQEVIIANSMQNQKRSPSPCRRSSTSAAGPAGPGPMPAPPPQLNALLRITQRPPDPADEHVERVTDARVAMPRNLLRRADLQLGDAESRALQMMHDPLDIKAGR